MFNPDISGKRTLLLFIIVLALIAWLPKPAIADEILWEYSNLSSPRDADRLPNGNTLITDGDNYRVIEVTVNGTIAWEYHWSGGDSYMTDADRLSNGNTLIADIGHYDGIIEVTPDGTIVWEYLGLNSPWDADRLPNGNTLITDWGNSRVIEVTPNDTIVWEYGVPWPRDADRLQNGNTLICDGDNHRIIEVTPDGTIVWECSTGPDYPYDVDRLPNGNTLISELYYGRVIEVTTNGTIVWQYGNLNLANDAERLPNGNTLICDRGNNRVIEVGIPTVTVSVSDTTYGAAGDIITIPVYTEDLTGLGVVSAEFDLTYNSCILTGIDVDSSGTLLSGTDWTCEYNVAGDTFSVILGGTETLDGSGTLINLIFSVSPDAQPGDESPLHFENFIFNEGVPPVTNEDGIFIVVQIGIEKIAPQIPRIFALSQNYPNPTSGITSISYQLSEKRNVSLKLYDVRGRYVKTLVDGTMEPGFHSVTWNTCDNNGKKLASGIYFYRLKAGEYVQTKKLIILR